MQEFIEPLNSQIKRTAKFVKRTKVAGFASFAVYSFKKKLGESEFQV
jgi:hypothetical protein